MTGPMLYDFNGITSGSEDILTSAKNLKEQLEQISTEVKKLVAEWDGQGSDTFQQFQHKWAGASNDLTELLMQIGNAVNQGGHDMNETDKRNAQSWGH